MAAEPSISEIVGRPDAELGTGQPAAPLDISSGLNAVTQAARDHSQNILERYSLFQKTLAQHAQNHQLDFAGVMNEDLPKLQEKANAYFAKVAQNPKMVTQIGQDPDWLDLQTSIQKSKQDNSYLSAQEEFRRAHPDLYNKTNDDIISGYRQSPLEARKAFNLDLPKTIDFANLGKTTLGEGQTVTSQNFHPTDENGNPIPGYYLETKSKQYDLKQYKDKVDALYKSDYQVDKYGHTVKQYADDHYGLLPDDVKKQYEQAGKEQGIDGEEAWFQQQMMTQYKPSDITESKLEENKYGEKQQELAQKDKEIAIQKGRLGVEEGNLGLNWWKAKNVDLPKSRAQMDLWKSNTVGGEEQKTAAIGFAQNLIGQLQDLGKRNAEGGYMIYPDKIRQMTNEQLKYLGITTPEQRDKYGTVTQSAGLQPMKVTDKDAIEISPTGQIRVFTNATVLPDGRVKGTLKPQLNTTVQNIMTNRINEELKTAGSKELNAYLPADLMGTEGETPENTTVVSQTPTGTSQTAVTKSSEKGKTTNKTYNYKGKPIPIEAIQKAAQASGMTVDEYIQKAGIK